MQGSVQPLVFPAASIHVPQKDNSRRAGENMPKCLSICVVFVLGMALSFGAGVIRAQVGNSGSIEGVVKDPSGGVVAGATVEISYAFHGDHYKWSLRFMVINLTNKTA